MNPSAGRYDVIIGGAGPAGTGAAIHLTLSGARVLLFDREKFPRQKLCGEFVSPECLQHFERLGVIDKMLSSGSASLDRTVFYSRTGRSVVVPSAWFGSANALGLSRSQMDHNLLNRAKAVGVSVLEGVQAAELIVDGQRVCGVRVRCENEAGDHMAAITIDATGRTQALARRLATETTDFRRTRKPSLVAFKAHLENAYLNERACEIYSYPGGYGGLSSVENDLTNLCFIVSAETVRHYGSDPEEVMRQVVCQNPRASHTLAAARACTDWLAVSLGQFGRRRLVPAKGLLTIGDAAAFIDPFTGSGMLMALESGEVVARAILSHLRIIRTDGAFELVAREYQRNYFRSFNRRLRISGLLRSVAFVPQFAEAAVLLFGFSEGFRRAVAQATRSGRQ